MSEEACSFQSRKMIFIYIRGGVPTRVPRQMSWLIVFITKRSLTPGKSATMCERGGWGKCGQQMHACVFSACSSQSRKMIFIYIRGGVPTRVPRQMSWLIVFITKLQSRECNQSHQ